MIVFSVIIIACNTDIQSENQQAPDQANSKNIVIETKENATSVPSDSTMIDKTPSQHTNEENIIFYDEKYIPFNRFIDSNGLRIFVLDGVSEDIIFKITHTFESMWESTLHTDELLRQELRDTFKKRYVYQRVGYANPDYYGGEPPVYPLIADKLNENTSEYTHNHIDYIWEKEPQEQTRQSIEVIEHLLHTITDQGLRFVFPETWDWNDPNSMLVRAMNDAIDKGYYNIESYDDIKKHSLDDFNRVIATEFAFWMILSAWDMFEITNMSANEEWNIDSSKVLEQELPIAYELYKSTVKKVLSPPNHDYLKELYSLNTLERKNKEEQGAGNNTPPSQITPKPEENPSTIQINPSAKTTETLPIFEVVSEHPKACINDHFSQFVRVHGMYVVGDEDAPSDYVLHTANILAQYLDNDEDGIPDDQVVTDYLVANGVIVPVWTKDIRENFWSSARGTWCEDNIRTVASMYHADSQWAIGGIEKAKIWDSNLEEVWHVVSEAWYRVYPEYFNDKFDDPRDSLLTEAVDAARGGYFEEAPKVYPAEAWYRYFDCPYGCQVHEYFYWITVANIGALDPAITNWCPNEEWSICTKEELRIRDVRAYDLLNNHGFKLPTHIPDGSYSPTKQ